MFEVLPYQLVLSMHIAAFVWSAVGIVAADSQGLRWFLGWVPTIAPRYVHFWHRWVWAGLITSIGTGFYMFWPVRDYLLGEPTFLFKVSLVLVLVSNAIFIGTHMSTATQQPFAELPTSTKRTLLISGLVSAAGWVSVATLGLLLPL